MAQAPQVATTGATPATSPAVNGKAKKAAAPVLQLPADYTGDPVFDVHEEYRINSACGLGHTTHLDSLEAEDIGAALRGIAGCIAVFTAESGGRLDLGEGIRGDLIDAIRTLNAFAQRRLERASDRSQKLNA